VRTVSPARVSSIAAPLLVVTPSLDEVRVAGQLFGSVPDVTVLGVFGLPDRSEPVIDLRPGGGASEAPEPVTALSLARAPGDRTHTKEIAGLIADAIERSGASTVAVGLGLRGGDGLEASDAALRARRRARARTRWIVYFDGDPDADTNTDAGRIARRRMLLLLRGIRLDPVALAEAPAGAAARCWEIRASDGP
jgi:hypothetical protein